MRFGDFESMLGLARTLTLVSNELDGARDIGQSVTGHLVSGAGAWEGKASSAFEIEWGQTGTALLNLAQTLGETSGVLANLVTKLEIALEDWNRAVYLAGTVNSTIDESGRVIPGLDIARSLESSNINELAQTITNRAILIAEQAWEDASTALSNITQPSVTQGTSDVEASPWSKLLSIAGIAQTFAAVPDGMLNNAHKFLSDAVDAMSNAGRVMSSGSSADERSAAAAAMWAARKSKSYASDAVSSAENTASAFGGKLGYVSKAMNLSLGDLKIGGDIGEHIPVVGVVLTAVSAVYDISQHKYLNAAGDVGGFAASVAATAITVALVGTPVGWTVLGVAAVGIGVGAGVTWAIDNYKTVESFAGGAADAVAGAAGDAAHAVGGAVHDLTSWL